MKTNFSVIHLLMLVGVLIGCLSIGCSETDHASLLASHESNPSFHPAGSVDTVAQPLPPMTEQFAPLPSKQEEVAAAPVPFLALIPAVGTVVSCGATVFDLATLALGTPDFLANPSSMFVVGVVSLACPADKPIKAIKVLKSANTLKNIKFLKFSEWTYRENFKRFIRRPISPGYDIHHGIPQTHRAAALKYGIIVDQPVHLIEILKRYHQTITPMYRKDWEKFFALPNLSRSKILNFEQFMLEKYRLKSGSYLDLILE